MLPTQSYLKLKQEYLKNGNQEIDEGHCEEVYDLDEVDLTQGNWLILARTNYQIN